MSFKKIKGCQKFTRAQVFVDLAKGAHLKSLKTPEQGATSFVTCNNFDLDDCQKKLHCAWTRYCISAFFCAICQPKM